MGLIIVLLLILISGIAVAVITKIGSSGTSGDDTQCRQTKIAGINYRKGLSKYVGPFKGNLVPEPDNPYERNAIKVVHLDGHHLGYIPTEDLAEVAALVASDTYPTPYPYPCVGTIKKHYDEDEGRTFYSSELHIPYPGQKYLTDIRALHPEIYANNVPQ